MLSPIEGSVRSVSVIEDKFKIQWIFIQAKPCATVLSALKKDAENAMNWFKDKFMQANPEKFQFMFLKKYTSKEIVPNSLKYMVLK